MLEDYNYWYLSGDITEDSIDPIIENILEINLEKKQPPFFKLIINSMGGDIDSAMALVDVIKGSKTPIHTFGIGNVSSAALMILMSGEKYHRYVSKNTSLMSHACMHPSIEGRSDDYISYMKAIDISKNMFIQHYKECTGLDEETITKELLNGNDVYLTPQEALNYGIVDKIDIIK